MSSRNHTLPAHIRQLVDKKNYVIAIKTHAQEQGISLADAKAQIDAYEHSQMPMPAQTKTTVQHNDIEHLQRGVDQHLTDHNIRLPWLKRWQKRVLIFAVIVLVLGLLIYRQFG